MHDVVQGAVLGTLQGLTEFLPVSSSGHLVLARHLLGVESPGIAVEIMAHAGTLLAIVLYFARDLWRILRNREALLQVLIGVIPAGLAGVLLKDVLEQAFAHPGVLAITFALNGGYLISTRGRTPRGEVTRGRAWWIGVSQVAALLPGISRSGTTITTALHLGVDTDTAFRFSFLIGFPLMVGALGLEVMSGEWRALPTGLVGATFISALLSGLLALTGLRRFTLQGRLWIFGVYTLALAGGVGLWLR